MTPRQIELVRRCWPRVEPQREALAQHFYARLFEQAPETRAQFRGDLPAQAAKLAATLNVVVEHLDNLRPLHDTLGQLGRVHLQWHVTQAQYEQVREALLCALEHQAGPEFDSELRAAWHAAYEAAAAPMKAAAYGAVGAVGAIGPAGARGGGKTG